ncbi:ORC1-type DNA replication protein [Thermogladius sp. KZ2Tp1]|uniref:ORC1-type DNA replication protein n=1 Tax=unclassified Thermogladius TaxID=2647734 RepID=UPI003D0F5523
MGEDVWKIIEEEVERPSIFKSKESLTPEYIPDTLPHREKELKELASYFKHLVSSPGSFSQRVLLIGGVGTGKTATARVFGRDFTRYALTKGYKVKYAHVNCHSNRTLYNVIADMSRQLNAPLPSRGLSAREMFEALLAHLDETDQYAIISLDEFHYFASLAGRDAVYFIVRAYDVFETPVKRLNFVFISQDTAKLSLLDPSLESYLLRHMIKLEPYTSAQLLDILKYRASKAFYEGTYDDTVLKFIADYEGRDKGGGGNARHAIEVLMIAGVMAENEGAKRITLEHARKAIMKISRDIVNVSEAINYSSLHELLVLLAAVRLLRRTGNPYVKIGDVEKEYEMVCETLGQQPRRHTQVYEYVMNLKKAGIIEAKSSGKGMKGRTTLIGINYGPLDMLEQYLMDLIKRKIAIGAT